MSEVTGEFVGHHACIDCDSSDGLALHVNEDDTYSAYCWAQCEEESKYKSHNRLAKSYLGEELGIEVKKRGRVKVKRKLKRKSTPKKIITDAERDYILENSSEKGKGFRGIKDKWLKFYRVRTEFGDKNNVVNRYYPVTEGKDENGVPKLVGYHKRIVEPEKDFRAIGKNSKECEMFGQFRCKGNKKIVITGGQEDTMAAKQMFEEYKARKDGSIVTVDFVSGTVGEGSAAAQVQHNYDFFDRYDEILIDMDDDVAGEKAVTQLLDVLPYHKVKIMVYSEKDANAALEEGLEGEYIRAIYNARKPRMAGVVSGESMWDAMIEAVSAPLIPLPPMLAPLELKLCGGLPIAEIINILAASGIGKTSITNNLIEFWIFNSPYKIGILSMEAGAGKFLTRLVSGYLGTNIARLSSNEEKIEFLEENKENCFNLFFDENGDERFYLVDDKGDLDSLEAIKRTVERMVKQGGCKIIIIDPIQDALDSLSVEEQAAFVGWQKKVKARDGVTFININHTRKGSGGKKAGSQGGELTEEDMQGTSALYKSGAVNIILTRDKTNDDPDIRNTTRVTLFKARDTGETGPAGELFYEIETSRLHNKEAWMKDNADKQEF